ncbi:PhoH family protein [Flavimobilis sp. GY10621]|uniref:PhoH-like protein n=1 Tax=Flavimobilis rhizosphaerae TaxID=2775421 RepID=A0ABR9DSK5_9MICO|nr:PhoH family protein [Flavimobilis rhizosphaerae]MBD9700128.1 PhoH family protein [Flavimobilis rhizosphaerae]
MDDRTRTPAAGRRRGTPPTSSTPTDDGPRTRGQARLEHRIVVPPQVPMVALLGTGDAVLRALEDGFARVDFFVRGNEITVTGPAGDVGLAVRLVDELVEVCSSGTPLGPDVVARSIAMLTEPGGARPADVLTVDIVSSRGRTVRPKTVGQKRYVDAIDASTITFGIGPAGTGKTYLAVAKAVQALQDHKVSRVVLTRPAVEAGERLGFLPGSLTEKIDPYVRPLYDALHDMLEPDSIPRLLEAGTIEVAPLAYMRGRTLNDAFVILDEAQNTTPEQMKMFLTRLGFGSTMVVTGDTTQIDLPGGVRSGLKVVEDVLVGVDDVEFCHLTSQDVVRHRLVGEIIEAYARWDVTQPGPASRGTSDPRQGPGRTERRS